MAKKRTNVIRTCNCTPLVYCPPNDSRLAIVEDARLPNKYRMLLPLVDVIFADVAQPDQARIVVHNAESFLKEGGHIIISIKASCIDSTVPPETIFASEVQYLKEHNFKPIEQVTLEPYERDHAMVTGMCAWTSVRHASNSSFQRYTAGTEAPSDFAEFFTLIWVERIRRWV